MQRSYKISIDTPRYLIGNTVELNRNYMVIHYDTQKDIFDLSECGQFWEFKESVYKHTRTIIFSAIQEDLYPANTSFKTEFLTDSYLIRGIIEMNKRIKLDKKRKKDLNWIEDNFPNILENRACYDLKVYGEIIQLEVLKEEEIIKWVKNLHFV